MVYPHLTERYDLNTSGKTLEEIRSLQDLQESYAEKLQLHWIGSIPEEPILLAPYTVDNEQAALISSLNTIHPSLVQVIGPAEQEYLLGLGSNAYHETLERLFAHQPLAIIYSNNLVPTETLQQQAIASKTPVLQSALSDHLLIDNLAFLLEQILAKRQTIHGVFVEVHGLGVLLTGSPAIGKSELAMELISRGHRLVADDAPCFTRIAPGILEGTCAEMYRGFLELRGLGILNVVAMYGEGVVLRSKRLKLVIELKRLNDTQLNDIDRLTGSLTTTTIMGEDIPKIIMPVATGRNLAILVETAVKQQILLRRGYDASADLIQRQTSKKNRSK